MIVGPALANKKGDPVWPCFEMKPDLSGYAFVYKGDDDSFLGVIQDFDFEHFLNYGCNEAKLEFEGLMWEYYDETITE